MTGPLLKLRLRQIRWEAQDICSYAFVSATAQPLPPLAPGAHIGLHLPAGQVRSYSLLGLASDRGLYEVAVQRQAQGRGASRWRQERRSGQSMLACCSGSLSPEIVLDL